MQTYIFLAAVFLFLQCESLKSESHQMWLYSFHANTSIGNDLLTQAASQWTLSGKLYIHSHEHYKIMKLQDLISSSYNGPRERLMDVEETEIPKEANILTAAFVAYYDQNHKNLESVHFIPDEPIWSMNIKKAIASAYQLNYQMNSIQNDVEGETEENIFGKCDLKYELDKKGAKLAFIKRIDVKKCKLENTSRKHWQNTKHGQFSSKTVRNYIYNNKNQINDYNTVPFDEILSNTTMQYSKRRTDEFGQIVQQMIALHLEQNTVASNAPDISKHTVVKTPAYEFEKSEQQSNLTEEQKYENWLTYYEALREVLESNHTEYYSEKTFHMFENLYTTVSSMDYETLDKFRGERFWNETQMMNIFGSLTPFIGTDGSTEYIKQRLEYEYFADSHALAVMFNFPIYLRHIDEKLLIEMEEYPFANMTDNRAIWHAHILMFSNLVSRLDGSIDKIEPQQDLVDIVKRYINIYYNLFLETNEPNVRINYLLGLGNMGSASIDYLISIVKNQIETRHIRALATYTVKPLIVDRKDIAFRIFWPIVKSQCEPYELRVAALTLLLESYLDSAEFYSIFIYMKKITDDPVEQHLYNYFYTRLNCHKFWKQINYLADIFLADLKPPQATKGLMTGRYYAQYSDEDENFRSSLDTHIVANPATNFPNVFRVTFSDYINQNDMLNSFTLYVKAEGIAKLKNDFQMPIKELFNILHTYELDASPEDFYIEIVVYYNGKAVFSWVVADNDSPDKIALKNMVDDIGMYYADIDSMKFEYLDQNEFVTDLGTSVVSELKNENLFSSHFNMDGPDLPIEGNQTENYFEGNVKYMSIEKNDLKSFNPITKINHGVSSIYSLQRFLNYKVEHNLMDDFTLRWNDENNLLEHVVDFKDAVYISTLDNGSTEKHCPNCSSVYFLNIPVQEQVIDLLIFKMKTVNCTASEAPSSDVFYKSRIVNSGSQILNPLLSLFYARDYFHNVAPYDTCSGMFYLATNKEEPKEYSLYFKQQFSVEKELNIMPLSRNISINLYQHRMSDKQLVNEWFFQLLKEQDYERDTLKIVVDDKNKLLRITLDSWFVTHHKLPAYDMFSLSSPPPMSSNADILVHVNETLAYKLGIKALFEVSEKKKELVKKSETYAICLADSLGMIKHSPPTKACFDVSKELSIYDDYTVDLELYQRVNIIKAIVSQLVALLLKSNNDMDPSSTDNFQIKYSAQNGVLEVYSDKEQIQKITVPKLFRYNLQPKNKLIQDVLYNSYGINSVCIITPYNVKTFLESNVPYESMFAKSMVPLIQCSNNSRIGLVTTVEDYRIGFRFWYDDDIFELNTSKNLTMNGIDVQNDQENDSHKVQFYDDSFVILTKIVELYYNQDYVSIKMKSMRIPDFCGTCSSDELTATNIPESLYREE